MNCNNILSYFVISLKTELLFTKNTKILKIVLKFLYREAPLRGPTPYPSLNHFSRKRYPFRIPAVDKWIPFNGCKWLVIQIGIIESQNVFSTL